MGYSPWGAKQLDTTERLTCAAGQSSGQDSALPLQGAQALSLVWKILHATRCGQKINEAFFFFNKKVSLVGKF